MGLLDNIRSGEPSANTARGVNEVPAPQSDAHRNAPPVEQHKRVADFVRVRVCKGVVLIVPVDDEGNEGIAKGSGRMIGIPGLKVDRWTGRRGLLKDG